MNLKNSYFKLYKHVLVLGAVDDIGVKVEAKVGYHLAVGHPEEPQSPSFRVVVEDKSLTLDKENINQSFFISSTCTSVKSLMTEKMPSCSL